MANTLGQNRLATGFAKPTKPKPLDTRQQPSPADSPQEMSPAGHSADSAIEISDDDDDEDMAESEGGIVLNFEHDKNQLDVVSVSDGVDSGEIHTDDDKPYSPKSPPGLIVQKSTGYDHADEEMSFVIDPAPMGTLKKLADLTSQRREEQIKYAFYHLPRDEIDLGRPVICLRCFQEGHLDEDCAQQTLFPVFSCRPGQSAKLWISCCVCASKDHLVGDCPQHDQKLTKRWSLADVESKQIINLSLATGTQRLEKEAENRGLRPSGLSIKGRANRHTAGDQSQPSKDSSDDEPFLRTKRPRNNATLPSRPNKGDIFPEPSNRGRGGWYATDSFGRQRSPSPLARPPARERRSRSPRGDSWRADAHNTATDTWRPPPQSPAPRRNRNQGGKRPRSPSETNVQRASTTNRPVSNVPTTRISIDLPTRKGSNTWRSDNSVSGSNPPRPGTDTSQQRKKHPIRRRGRAK